MLHCPKHPSVKPAGLGEARQILKRHKGTFHHVRKGSWFADKPGTLYGETIGCALYILIQERSKQGGESSMNNAQSTGNNK